MSEQAIVYEKVGKCYSCFIHEVVEERDSRIEAADYKIDNCTSCTGLPGARDTCIPCGGKGWVVVDENDVKLITLQ